MIGLDISQAGPEGRVKWDAAHRLLKSAWLTPDETCTYRFRDTDLDKASPNRPFQVVATVSPDKRFEITYKIEDGVRVFLHYEWTIQFLKQFGIDNLEQGSKVGLSLLGIDNLEQWDRDSLRRLGIDYTGVTIMKATDLYG